MRRLRATSFALILCLSEAISQDPSDAVAIFEAEIRPLLHEHCVRCHGPEVSKAKLRLDSPEGIRRGGERGALIDLASLSQSLLLRAISYEDEDLQMPPKTRLPEPARRKLEKWILHGAPMPTASLEPISDGGAASFEARKSHWSLRPPFKTKDPKLRREPPPKDRIDAFLLAKLEEAGIEPAPLAPPVAILRRAAYVLTGLPLSETELARFEQGRFDDVYPQLVDLWLESPHFGERFARHWMDVVRYAESKGHEFDFPIPGAWHYRDYLIRAFCADLPYDQFLLEHFAGDLLAPRRHPTRGFNEAPLATAFFNFGEECHSPVDLRADDADRLADRVDTLSKTFLGLTVACARCHDHKFDAITQADYTALVGVVQSASYRQLRLLEDEDAQVAAACRVLEAELRPKLLKNLEGALAQEAKNLPRILSEVRAHKRSPSELRSDLRPYAEHLERAASNSRSIWHPWAAALAAPSEDRAKVFSAALEVQRELLKATLPQAAVTLADYRAGSSVSLIVDGEAFGRHAADAGSIHWITNPNVPIQGLLPFGAALYNAVFDPLEGGPPGYPGAMVQPSAGRLLRTPSFQLRSGVLHHLVRGRGVTFVEVDGHRLVNGPLHGSTHKVLNDGDDWRWVRQDLSAYAGSRAHAEYVSSGPDSGFAVAQVLDSAADPAPPAFLSENLLRRLSLLDSPTEAAIDNAYAEALAEASVQPTERDHAAIFNDWLSLRRSVETSWLDAATAAELATASTRRQELKARVQATKDTASAVLEGSGMDSPLLARGSPKNPGALIPRGGVAATGDGLVAGSFSGSGRLQLGRSLVRKEHPLVSRVYVNRLWHWVFEQGLVASVDDFGAMGDLPTHPQLLDVLALEFQESGWSTKRLLRRFVLTEAFQRSTTANPASEIADPRNHLLHRSPLRRRDAESLYDALLVASGSWNRGVGGPSQNVHLSDEMVGRGRPEHSGPIDGGGRRALYLGVRRNFLSPFLLAFDFPAPNITRGRRHVSHVPAQVLSLQNDPFVRTHAEGLGRRMVSSEASDDARINFAYRILFSRAPNSQELEHGLAFLKAERQAAAESDKDFAACSAYAHVLINTQEFLFLP